MADRPDPAPNGAASDVVLRLRLRAPADSARGGSHKRPRAARGGPPPGVDDEVWSALPPEVQAELLEAARAAASESESEGSSSDEVVVVERQASNPAKVPRLEGGASSSSLSSSSLSSPSSSLAGAASGEPLSALTWNVWFSDLKLQQRMLGVCKTLAREKPRFVALQEVTLQILELLRPQLVELGYDVRVQAPSCPYFCALAVRDAKWDSVRELPFVNSEMGRCLLYGRARLPGVGSVLVATTHLESPMPPAMNTKERQAQLASCFKVLGEAMSGSSPRPSAVLLMGDLNWTEGGRPRKNNPNVLTQVRDGDLDLPSNWRDAWEATHAGLGYFESCTYNSSTNKMLSGTLSYRADRVLFWGQDVEPRAARMVGTEPLKDVTHVRNGAVKPVYCSDHYGVLATFGFGR
jgi:tyrosyl-DNA phosphodiesterase 2